MTTLPRDARIYVAGGTGLVGRALCRKLLGSGFENLLTPTHRELDLTDLREVKKFFAKERPDFVFDAAARVGGIVANDTYPADFIRDNLLIQTHLIDCAYHAGVKKFLFLGSSCMYPKHTEQPMRESQLLTGSLEPTNRAYALAKLAGIEMCLSYRRQHGFPCVSLVPTNLYGPNDNFDLETSHVVPALIRKVHTAHVKGDPHVVVWGSGTPRREFLYVDDLADAALVLMERWEDPNPINVGTGQDVTIRELAEAICRVVGFKGKLEFDSRKPDGTPQKLLDVSKLSALGWRAKTQLAEGLERTYRWFAENAAA